MTPIVQALQDAWHSFAADELAYLALTSKAEFAVRDRLALALHRRLWPRMLVAREWRRTDLAILSRDVPPRPLVLLEAKALYTFDAAASFVGVGDYRAFIRADVTKAHLLAGEDTEVYALALATHPRSIPPRELRDAVKYLRGITRELERLGSAEEVLRVASNEMNDLMESLGHTERGMFFGGSAFGVEVDMAWWVAGPVALSTRGLR